MSATAATTYILIALWPINGAWVEKETPATNGDDCAVAAKAMLAGVGVPLYNASGPPRWARCVPGNIWPKDWNCIKTSSPIKAEYHCR